MTVLGAVVTTFPRTRKPGAWVSFWAAYLTPSVSCPQAMGSGWLWALVALPITHHPHKGLSALVMKSRL